MHKDFYEHKYGDRPKDFDKDEDWSFTPYTELGERTGGEKATGDGHKAKGGEWGNRGPGREE